MKELTRELTFSIRGALSAVLDAWQESRRQQALHFLTGYHHRHTALTAADNGPQAGHHFSDVWADALRARRDAKIVRNLFADHDRRHGARAGPETRSISVQV
jgi:hypothetical protein